MVKKSKKEKDAEKLITSMVRLASVTQLQVVTSASEDEITIEDVLPDTDLSYDHWVSVIFVSGKALRMTFRTHFSSKDARSLAARTFEKEIEEVNVEISHDFIREFCNLTAGAVKRCIIEAQSDDESDVSIGVPEQFPSYDGVNIKNEVSKRPHTNFWALKLDENELICAASIEVLDWSLIESIETLEFSSILVSSEGDIQFL